MLVFQKENEICDGVFFDPLLMIKGVAFYNIIVLGVQKPDKYVVKIINQKIRLCFVVLYLQRLRLNLDPQFNKDFFLNF